jgi:hypothetical protein
MSMRAKYTPPGTPGAVKRSPSCWLSILFGKQLWIIDATAMSLFRVAR